MSTFISAMDVPSDSKGKKGINGADVYTEEGVGSKLVTLYTMLVRNSTTIAEDMEKVVRGASPQLLKDLWVLAFQTRDVRGGKGERKLFYKMFSALKDTLSPFALKAMLALVPEYGSYLDLIKIGNTNHDLVLPILKLIKKTLLADEENALAQKPISLLAKWLPREGSKWDGTLCSAISIATFLYKEETDTTIALMKYRKRVSALNRILKTVEINMCDHKWAKISPSSVPGKCLKKQTRALLNLNSKHHSGIRFPLSEDRMACRENFLKHFQKVQTGEAKVNGAETVQPHELVVSILEGESDADVLRSLQCQWDSICSATAAAGGLGRVVPLADFSGSMDGVPKAVSLALAILVSSVNHPSFRNRMISFDSTPTWHIFREGASLKEKIDSVGDIGQGLSTNVQKALELILERMIAARVPVGEEPDDILILTDMGWDQLTRNSSAYNGFETILTYFKRAFKEEGEKLWGAGLGWKVPRFIVMNLRAQYKDFHAQALTEGVVFLSGWSPAVFASLQSGGVCVQTPFDCLRSQLDSPRYDRVRDVFKL